MKPSPARQAMTLIELLVVVAIITALSGMIYAGALGLFGNSRVKAARALVKGAHIACASAGKNTVNVPNTRDPSQPGVMRRFGDFNKDGILDGRPAEDFDNDQDKQMAEAANYGGFLAETDFSARNKFHQDEAGRVIDPWGFPLRISFSAKDFGPSGFKIWSMGPDREPDTEDDISSTDDEHWENQ